MAVVFRILSSSDPTSADAIALGTNEARFLDSRTWAPRTDPSTGLQNAYRAHEVLSDARRVIVLATESTTNAPLAYMSCRRLADGIEVDLLRHRTSTLTSAARDAFGRLIKNHCTRWAAFGIKRGYFTVPQATLDILVNLFANATYAITVTIVSQKPSVIQKGQVDVIVSFSA